MNKAFVFRILLAKTFGCARFIWNQMLSDKKEYPFLCEVDSLALANEQLSLEKAYKNFWNGNIEIADSKIKLQTCQNSNG